MSFLEGNSSLAETQYSPLHRPSMAIRALSSYIERTMNTIDVVQSHHKAQYKRPKSPDKVAQASVT